MIVSQYDKDTIDYIQQEICQSAETAKSKSDKKDSDEDTKRLEVQIDAMNVRKDNQIMIKRFEQGLNNF